MSKYLPFILSIEVTPGMNRILLFREGKNEYVSKPSATLTEANANKIIAEFESWGRDMQIDYNHDSVNEEMPGPKPAAGWIDKLEFVKGEGLIAHIKNWTTKATELITNREYRYFSPVCWVTKVGKMIVGLHNIALTNDPETKNLQPLIAERDKYFNNNLEDSMKELLCKLLGIKIDTEDEKVEAAAEKLLGEKVTVLSMQTTITDQKEKIDGHKDRTGEIEQIAAAIGLEKDAKTDAIITKVTAIEGDKSSIQKALEKTNADLSVLQKAGHDRDTDDVIKNALNTGKITAADVEKWARDMAAKQPDVFASMMETRPEIVPVTVPVVNPDDPASFTNEDKLAAEKMGMSLKELAEGSKPLEVTV